MASPVLRKTVLQFPILFSIIFLQFLPKSSPECMEKVISNNCDCTNYGCDGFVPGPGALTTSGTCVSTKAYCSKSFFSPKDCVRPHAIYVHGGVFCQNATQKGKPENCKVESTILAVNFAGKSHVESRTGIRFKSEREVSSLMSDPFNTRKTDYSKKILGVPSADYPLYRHQIWGDWNQAKSGRCLTYEVPLSGCRDGRYELSVKTVDNYHSTPGKRGFNVYLNGVLVMPEVDIIGLSGERFAAIDMNVNFEVSKGATLMKIHGRREYNELILNCKIDLSFCYGRCGTEDKDYHVAGFSVLRFKN